MQRAIVAAANAAVNTSSGPSLASASGGVRPWLTDVEPAAESGAAIRAAINRYHTWYAGGKKTKLQVVKDAMIADLGKSLYDGARQRALAERIVTAYDAQTSTSSVVPPSTVQATLDFLGIRKMCLEWAVTIAINSHGLAKGYAPSGYNDMAPALYRPGMGLFKADHSHAMLIVDIYWDKSGQPQKFRVAEANFGPGWQNPGGMVPWERTVQNKRDNVLRGADHVIDFEVPY